MRYQVLIMKRAKRQLDKLPIGVQERIAEGIGKLGNNPDDFSLDVKSLTNDSEARFSVKHSRSEPSSPSPAGGRGQG